MFKRKINNKKSYIVYDAEWNIDTQTDNYEEAIKRYEQLKQQWNDEMDGEFSGDERVILAEVIKDFYSNQTEEKDENGDYYWSFYEDDYK